MTQEMLIDLANTRYHHSQQAALDALAGYTPDQIDALEYDAWLNNQDDRTPEEYDAVMCELFSNYGDR